MNRPYLLARVATCALISLVPFAAAAQDALAAANGADPALGATEVNGDIVVTGTMLPDTPLATRTEREDLDRRSVQSFEDLGRRVDAGVNFSRQTNSVNIRGLDSDRVLMTLDGIRLPWLGRDARGVSGGVTSFDFDTLAAIDIVRGADSSLAGSGALAGSLALRTLDPEDLLGSDRGFGARALAGYDETDESYRGNIATAGRFGDTLVLASAAYREGHEIASQGDVDGYGATRTRKNPADYDQQSFQVKLAHYLDGGHRLGISADHFRRDQTTDLRTDQGTSFEIGANTGGEINERQRVILGYDYAAPGAATTVDRGTVRAYWQRQQVETTQDGVRTRDARANIIPGDPFQYGFPTGPYGRDSTIEEEGFGLIGRIARGFGGGAARHELRAGFDVYRADTTQYSGGYDNCPDYPPGLPQPFGPQTCIFLKTNQADLPTVQGTALGVYLEDEMALAGGTVRLTPGLRFDAYEQAPQLTAAYADSPAFDGLPPKSSDERLSGKLRGELDIAPATMLFAQWAQGFRAPTPTELYLRFGGPGSYLRVGNADLKAETSNGFEIGLRRDGTAIDGGIGVFLNDYRDFIDTIAVDAAEIGIDPADYPLGITGSVNRDRVRIWGIEARADWNFAAGWRVWGSLAYTEGTDRETDQPLNSVAPLRAITGLGYAHAEWGVDASVTAAAARDEVENPGTDFEAPAYQVADLIGWFEPRWAGGARLQLAVLNLFDETYWNALSVPEGALPLAPEYYTEPGRTFRASLSFRF